MVDELMKQQGQCGGSPSEAKLRIPCHSSGHISWVSHTFPIVLPLLSQSSHTRSLHIQEMTHFRGKWTRIWPRFEIFKMRVLSECRRLYLKIPVTAQVASVSSAQITQYFVVSSFTTLGEKIENRTSCKWNQINKFGFLQEGQTRLF